MRGKVVCIYNCVGTALGAVEWELLELAKNNRDNCGGKEKEEKEELLELEISRNVEVVRALYAALSRGDAASVQALVDEDDLEYWFHGPPSQQHMMRLLTGATSCGDTTGFAFTPSSVVCGSANVNDGSSRVFVEGKAGGGQSTADCSSWVHIWTVKKRKKPDGCECNHSAGGFVITQLREYFNTAIYVTSLKPMATAPSPHVNVSLPGCVSVWQSQNWKTSEGRSMPGLILTI